MPWWQTSRRRRNWEESSSESLTDAFRYNRRSRLDINSLMLITSEGSPDKGGAFGSAASAGFLGAFLSRVQKLKGPYKSAMKNVVLGISLPLV